MATPTPKLALPGQVTLGESPGSWHTLWNQLCANAEERFHKSGSGNPNGGVAGDYVGQFYYRTDQPDIYYCTTAGTVLTAVWSSLFHNTHNVYAALTHSRSVLTSSAGSVAVNLALANFFTLTMTENATIQNPTNVPSGGIFGITVIGAGSPIYRLSWGTAYKWGLGQQPASPGTSGRITYLFSVADNGDLISLTPFGGKVTAVNGNGTTLSTAEVGVPGFIGVSIPTADGNHEFRLRVSVQVTNGAGTAQLVTFRVRMGPSGAITDPELFKIIESMPATTGYRLHFFLDRRFTPAQLDRITITVQAASSSVAVVYAAFATDNPHLEIEEVQ